MDTVQKRNSLSDSKPVLRRALNPRRTSLSKTLSMFEPTNLIIEPQRQVPMIDVRPVSSFTTKDEYVDAMVEDLCEWFNFLYKLDDADQMTPSGFFVQLNDGVILNKHASVVQNLAESYLKSEKITSRSLPLKIGNQIMKVPKSTPTYVNVDFSKKINAFHKRDNISNFIHWCRDFNIPPGLTFETDDLILLKNPRNVVVCLLEIARIGGLFGIEVPDIIQLDEEINKEIVNGTNSSNGNGNSDQDEDFSVKCDKRKFSDPNITLRKKTNLPTKLFGYKCYQDSKTIHSDKTLMLDNIDNSLSSLELTYPGYFSYTNGRSDPGYLKIDNSDNESINSHGSQYTIPKYKTPRPVGRVKIYDCFDRSDFVREKKYREKCDMRSLDERVRDILSECQCSETFPMKRISDGKYQWGDKKTLIFVRILRNHVMVRVGGGWDTLNNFLRKHDHCRKDSQNTKRHMSTPQIRKPLNPCVTCPSNLKISLQVPNAHNENQGTNKRNSTMNFLPKDVYCNTELSPGTVRSISLIQSASSHNLQTEFKTVEDLKSHIKSDNKENSPKESHSVCPSGSSSITDFQAANIPDNTTDNKIIQSNQKLKKYFSKIPVLKKS